MSRHQSARWTRPKGFVRGAAPRASLPPTPPEHRARALELMAEKPDARRAAVRIFRETGRRYTEKTILRWWREPEA